MDEKKVDSLVSWFVYVFDFSPVPTPCAGYILGAGIRQWTRQ